MSDTMACMSTVRARRQRLWARSALRPAPPIALVLRSARRPVRPDMGVRYAVGVTARKIDRGAWARQVARLIEQESNGNKSRFAAQVGVTYKTINRWLNSEGDVKEENVREVARTLGIKPRDLLVLVGYYDEDELRPPPATQGIGDDEAVRMIEESDLPPSMKKRMLDRLQRRRSAERTEEADEVRWWIEQARR